MRPLRYVKAPSTSTGKYKKQQGRTDFQWREALSLVKEMLTIKIPAK
jgi:hypothetical protein